MSSENYVGIIMAENLRFPGQGSSSQGKSGPKAQPNGVADGRNGKDSVTGYRSDVETEK